MKTWKPLETILFLSTVLWHLPAFLLAFPTIHVKTWGVSLTTVTV